MPRLFTGLETPAERSRRSLATLRGGLHGARWIEPENYHVTLRFIGEVDDVPRAARSLSLLTRVRRAPFELRLEDLNSFGGSTRGPWSRALLPRTTAVMDLQAEHERLLRRVGL